MKKISLILGASAFAVASHGAACSPKHEEDRVTPGLEGVIYEGETSDEALAAMTALTAKPATKPFGFMSPVAGAKLPATPIPTFAWGDVTAPVLDAGTGFFHAEPVPFHWLGGRAAWAHGAALNGKAYFLRFSVPTNEKLVRVFTIKTTYQPSADVWKKLVDSNATITIKLQSATFDNNAIAQDGGPFDGTGVSFTVGP